MRVVELTVIGNVLRRSREAKLTISGVNVDPVDRDIRQIRRNDRAHIVRSEARVKKIVAAEPMVDAGVERGAELRSVRIEEKVIRFLSGRPKVGQRIQLEQVGRNRIHRQSGGRRICSDNSRRAQSLFCRSGYGAGYGILDACYLSEAFVSKKEKRPVLNDRTTNAATEVVLAKLGLRELGRGVKRIPGVERVVLKILVQRTVKPVASTFGNDTDQATRRSSALGSVVVGFYGHFLNGIDGGLDADGPDNAFVIVRTINLRVVELNVLPIHRK